MVSSSIEKKKAGKGLGCGFSFCRRKYLGQEPKVLRKWDTCISKGRALQTERERQALRGNMPGVMQEQPSFYIPKMATAIFLSPTWPSRALPSLPSIKSLCLLPFSLSRTLWLPWLVVYGKYDRRDARWHPGLVIKGRTASARLSFLGSLPLGPAAMLWGSPGHTEACMERDRGWASSWLHSHMRSRSTCSSPPELSPVNWHRVQQHWAFSLTPGLWAKWMIVVIFNHSVVG